MWKDGIQPTETFSVTSKMLFRKTQIGKISSSNYIQDLAECGHTVFNV